jgi:hypothetical protein
MGIYWTYCKIISQLVSGYQGNCAGNINPAKYEIVGGKENMLIIYRINYGHTVVESLLLSGIGVLIFLAFACDTSMIKFVRTISFIFIILISIF